MNVSTTSRITLLGAGLFLSIASYCPEAGAGFWEDQFAFPETSQSVPEGAESPSWSKRLNVVGIVQLRDDLGRQQAQELDLLARRLEDEIDVGVYSIDRVGLNWTVNYIVDFRLNRKVELPVFELPPDAMRELYRGFQPKRVEILPQVRLFGSDRRLLGTFRGVHSAKAIERALEQARKALEPWSDPLPEPVGERWVANGDFEKWEKDRGPQGWRVTESSETTVQAVRKRGWNTSTAMEIRAASSGANPMVYQRLSTIEALPGKRLRLSAAIQTNCIAQPVIALAIAHPREEARFRFVPDSPFKTQSGVTVPMRIVGVLDFREEKPAWNWKTKEFVFPSETPIPAELLNPTVFVYFNNPKDTGGAAMVDEVRLEVLD